MRALIAMALALSGCSLVDDYGRFHFSDAGGAPDGAADAARADDAGTHVGDLAATDDVGTSGSEGGMAGAVDLSTADGACGHDGEPCCNGTTCAVGNLCCPGTPNVCYRDVGPPCP